MKEWAREFYNSAAWQKSRKGYIMQRISSDGGMCEECGVKLGEIVHHKKKLTRDNITDDNIALAWENFEYVCQTCHNKIHMETINEREVKLDEEGNVIGASPPSREKYFF